MKYTHGEQRQPGKIPSYLVASSYIYKDEVTTHIYKKSP